MADITADAPHRPDRVTVGRVLRAHGIKGQVIVVPLTDRDDRFVAGARLEAGSGDRTLEIVSVCPYKGRLLVHFRGVDDRTAAEALHRTDLTIPGTAIGAAPEGSVWAWQLEGLALRGPDGVDLGRIRAVVENPAHDLLECVDADGRPYTVPYVAAFVDELVPGADHLVLRPIPGLLPGEEGVVAAPDAPDAPDAPEDLAE